MAFPTNSVWGDQTWGAGTWGEGTWGLFSQGVVVTLSGQQHNTLSLAGQESRHESLSGRQHNTISLEGRRG